MRHFSVLWTRWGCGALAVLTVLGAAGCGAKQPPVPPIPTQVAVVNTDRIPSDPQDPQWAAVAAFPAALLPQNVVEPGLTKPSISEVRVKALTDGRQVAFRLEWDDATPNDLPQSARFSDACAVQLPAGTGAVAPSAQMGEPGKPVAITFWRAFWQSVVDGRLGSLKDLYPNATPDHYPYEAPVLEKDPAAKAAAVARYAPSHAEGSQMDAPPNAPVQDLIAEGPGSLAPVDPANAQSTGRGLRTGKGWAVVIVRPLPISTNSPVLSQVAFAVWDGGKDEVGSRKMRTDWAPLVFPGKLP